MNGFDNPCTQSFALQGGCGLDFAEEIRREVADVQVGDFWHDTDVSYEAVRGQQNFRYPTIPPQRGRDWHSPELCGQPDMMILVPTCPVTALIRTYTDESKFPSYSSYCRGKRVSGQGPIS